MGLFRIEPGARESAPSVTSDFTRFRLARDLLPHALAGAVVPATGKSTRRDNRFDGKGEHTAMIGKSALAIAFAGTLSAAMHVAMDGATVHGARAEQDVSAPRGQDVQAPRGEDWRAPRGQDGEVPRGQAAETPRG
jgi:hypothetical protein